MGIALPDAAQLGRLPMRAVVAYAARIAGRASAGLHDIVADDVLENTCGLIESVATGGSIENVDPATLAVAGDSVVAAYSDSTSDCKSRDTSLLVFALVHAALAAMHTVLAARHPRETEYQMTRVAMLAYRAAGPLKALTEPSRVSALKATQRDYEVLRQRYGESENAVIGDPIDCLIGRPLLEENGAN